MEENVQQNNSVDTQEKLFTQAEIDNIVKSRLSREKEKAAVELSERSETISNLQKQLEELTSYKTLAEQVYEREFNSVPEGKRSLVPENLSLSDRLQYIMKNRELLYDVKAPSALPVPQTPPPVDRSIKDGMFGGKYSNLEDFAKNDPKGYIKARQEGKI